MAGFLALAVIGAAFLHEVSATGAGMRLMSKHEVMAKTTVDSAVKLVLGLNHTHPDLVSLIQENLGAKRRVKAALRASKSHALASAGAGASDAATDLLNEMMEETDVKLGIEQESCRNFNRSRLAMLKGTRGSIATFNAQANRARGDVLQASGEIRRLGRSIEETKADLRKHEKECREEIAAVKDELKIVTDDLDVMDSVLKATDCGDDGDSDFLQSHAEAGRAPMFLQTHGLVNCKHCNRGRGMVFMQSSKVQPLLNKLRSRDAHAYLQWNLKASFQEASRKSTLVSLAQVQVHHMTELTKGMAVVSHRRHGRKSALVQRRRSDNETANTSAVPEEPVPIDCQFSDKCTLETNPNCEALKDRFLLIQSQIFDKKEELEKELGDLEDSCEKQSTTYKEQLEGLETRQSEEQEKLATATGAQNEAEAGSHLKAEEFSTLSSEYTEKMTTCCDNMNNLMSEQCALAKIRGELLKMSDIDSYILDCEVSDWSYDACTVTCGGGQRKMSRSVLVKAEGGKACPPLEAYETCNDDECPIDCVLEDWEGWSDCSAECDGGTMSRSRKVVQEPANGGEECGSLQDSAQCNVQSCNKDCVLGDWTEWTGCSKACDVGSSKRIRPVAEPAVGTGVCPLPEDGVRLQFQDCNTFTCQSALATPSSLLRCTSKVDILVLLDGSGSLGGYGWSQSQAFAKTFISSLRGSDDSVHVALQLFSGPSTWTDYYNCISDDPNVQVSMEDDCSIKWIQHFTNDTASTANLVETNSWPAKSTLTSVALAQAEAELIHGREDASTLVVVITDGFPISQSRTLQAANSLKQKANLLWVPVGSSAPIDMIEELASLPKAEHIVHINSFQSMTSAEMINQVLANACPLVDFGGP